MRLKLGIINYLNTLPVYYALIKGIVSVNCKLVYGEPSALNFKLDKKFIDISPISSLAYAQNPDQYLVLPNLSISAMGKVESIYLFSNQKLADIKGNVAVTSTSLTSINLLKLLLKDNDVSYLTADGTTAFNHSACLKIGDEAIKCFYNNPFKYAYDLSEIWYQKTKLPFVFALWAVNKSVYEICPDDVRVIYKKLVISKDISQSQITEMANKKNNGIFPTPELCQQYLSNLEYELSQNYQDGFMEFQKQLVEFGLLEGVAKFKFIEI